jgi:D-psicose/D-tagatose/L-ribulose 3-epimerase
VSALPEGREVGALPLGAHISLWAVDSTLRELERAIGAADSLGLDFVQLSLSSLDTLDVSAARDLLVGHQMGCVAGLAVPWDVWEDRRRGELDRYLMRAVEAAAGLGSDVLSGALYTPMGERGGSTRRREELSLLRDSLKAVARYAASLGVKLGLEPLNRYETSLINTCREVLDFIVEIDEPNVFAQLDTFHMNIEEQDLYEAFTQTGERVGYVQLAESDRGVPGDGHLPWGAVFSGLRDIGYSGPLAFESFTIDNVALATAGCLWRDVVGDPDAFVTRGLEQLRARARLVGYAM